MAQERFGDHLDAQGKKSDSVRGGFREHAKLTVAEDATMKNVAKSYVAQHTGFLKQRGVLMSTQKKALSTAGSPDPAISAQLKALKAQDDALIQNQITQLKTGLGTARFQMFDSFVRQSVTKDVHWGPLTPAASSKKQ